MASGSATEPGNNNSPESGAAEKPEIQPLRLPTAEEIRGQDIWNNCAVRSVVSGVMGKISLQNFHFWQWTSTESARKYCECIDYASRK